MAKEDNRIHYGEPIDHNLDIGLALAKSRGTVHDEVEDTTNNCAQGVKASVWAMKNPWDPEARFTGEIMTVRSLLPPVPVQGAVRAIGLNYKDHAVSLHLSLELIDTTYNVPVSLILTDI